MHTKHSMIPRLCKRRSTPRSVLRERITTKERIHGFSSNECILFTCVCHIVLSYTPTVLFGCVTTHVYTLNPKMNLTIFLRNLV